MSKVPASMKKVPVDTVLLELQRLWYKTKEEWVNAGKPDSGPHKQGFDFADDRVTKYLWDKTRAEIEADRAAHPKAKRNAPVPLRPEVGGPNAAPGRVLP